MRPLRLQDLDAAAQLPILAGIAAPARPKIKRNDEAERLFAQQTRMYRLPKYTRKWRYPKSAFPHDARRYWEIDGCFLEQRLMIEIDGGIWMAGGGAHSHPVDITRNMTKQNDAMLLGFTLLRFTPREVRSTHAIEFTMRVLAARGWQSGT